MKKDVGIGTIVIIGLIIWWLMQRQKQAQAARLSPGAGDETEYEKLHTTVPITRFVEKEMPVYVSIEEGEASHG